MKKLVFCLSLAVLTAGLFASESDGIFLYKMGQFEIYMLVGAERDGNTSIIPGAGEAILKRYIPAAGFKHSTNAFLVKAPGRIVLIDTAFGGPIFEKIEKLGVKPEQVDAVLMTHLHGDHIGGLQKDGKPIFTKAKIYLDNKERDYFTKTAVNQAAVLALSAYGPNVITFDGSQFGSVAREILPGIRAIATYGHTPGHTSYLLESGRGKFIVAGDFLHIALVQFPHPDISATYDVDQIAAAASRAQIMEYAAKNRIPLGGMHIVYPGVGTVQADGNGYKFIPAQ